MDQPTETKPGLPPPVSPRVMIFGSGACARKIAHNLMQCGIGCWLAAGDDASLETGSREGLHWLAGAELQRCRGFAGNFELQLKDEQQILTETVPAIVVAQDHSHCPNYTPYGLAPGPRVMDISTLEAKLRRSDDRHLFHTAACVVFLCGWHDDSHPTVASRMLDGCFELQHQHDVNTFFMTGNLKVAANGAETRVQEAKRSGSVFLKFSDDYPTIVSLADNRFGITYMDELTRSPFQLEADWIVVDETIGPTRNLAVLTQRLGIDRDSLGFAQADNVRRLSNTTNRRGIFVAGGGRGILSTAEQMADADQVSLEVRAFLHDQNADILPKVTIQRGRCARCLTCHRLCPHVAIDIGAHISIVFEACQSCGICMASCPARAIEMEGLQIEAEIKRLMQPSRSMVHTPEKNPQIMVFGCTRSAGQAFALIRQMGRVLPVGVQFVEVPCGGSIASRDLLTAFESGADGVMLCPCHNDNCQSQIGSRVAHKRAVSVKVLLASAGLDDQRLRVAPVSANMGAELASMIEAFSAEMGARVDS